MAHPYHHALSSAKKWGGEVSDYLPLHTWFDLMWTCKLFHKLSLIEVVAPVVHRREVPVGPPGPPPAAVPHLPLSGVLESTAATHG
jgi:uncharacterized protein DUF6915